MKTSYKKGNLKGGGEELQIAFAVSRFHASHDTSCILNIGIQWSQTLGHLEQKEAPIKMLLIR
jgi:hypothetical protein